MNKELELLLSKDWKRRIITSIEKILNTIMNTKKSSIIFIIFMFLFTTGSLNGNEEINKRSRINFLLHTGLSFNTDTTFYRPAVITGFGFSYRLSKMLSLILYFKHNIFIPKEKKKWAWFMWIGDSPYPVKLEEPFYRGDLTDEFYDLLLDVKLKHKKLTNRLNFYSVAGLGATYRKEVVGWGIGIYGRQIYYAESILWLVSAGLGLEYDVNRNIDIFIEGSFNYSFFREFSAKVIPVKIGFAWKF
jgi:hypothetical protein